MFAAILLRDDFDGRSLRVLAKGSRDPMQVLVSLRFQNLGLDGLKRFYAL